MSVIFDQLRISDDGKRLHLNAHVNRASYFDAVTLKKITICTEEQVSETAPLSYGKDFIYQKDISPYIEEEVKPLTDKAEILSDRLVTDALNVYGGLILPYKRYTNVVSNYLSVVLSGKYPVLDTGLTPMLAVTSASFIPGVTSLNSADVLFTINGRTLTKGEHTVWQFKGKGEIKNNFPVCVYLFKQSSSGVYTPVSLKNTSDEGFLHFLWHFYGLFSTNNMRELHLVIDKAALDEAFNNTSRDEAGKIYALDSDLPIATKNFKASDFSHNMFFVYIETENDPTPGVPCRLDEPITLGVTFDYGLLYNQAMNYTRELADDCIVPRRFIDFILNTEALKLSIETEHYIPAINYWKQIVEEGTIEGVSEYKIIKPCGCHG